MKAPGKFVYFIGFTYFNLLVDAADYWLVDG